MLMTSCSTCATGISLCDNSGSKRSVWIFGFGKVTIDQNKPMALIVDQKLLGLYIDTTTGAKLGLGYQSSLATIIDPDYNVILEVEKNEKGEVEVTTY